MRASSKTPILNLLNIIFNKRFSIQYNRFLAGSFQLNWKQIHYLASHWKISNDSHF